MSYARILKLILVDLGLMVLLFAFATLIMHYVGRENPGCVACPAIVGYTFLFSSILALQPALWVEGVGAIGRVSIWFISILLGYSVYMKIAGLSIFSDLGMEVMYFVPPNIALFWLVFLFSVVGMIVLRQLYKRSSH